MLERLIVSFVIILISTGAVVTFRHLHVRRVGRITVDDEMDVDDWPTLLYFRSDSCAPCVTQNYYLQDLASQYENRLAIRKIDADIDRDVASKYGIFTLPTTLFVDQGGEVKYINYGLTPTNRLAQQLENLV